MSSLYIFWITSSIIIDLGYNTFLVDASAGNIIITIPTNPGDGSNFTINRVDTSINTVTIVATGSNINGTASPVSLASHENVLLGSFNGNWYTILGTWIQ